MDSAQKKVKKENCSSLLTDQIRRHLLDFDFEKMCSVSLSRLHVYCCLKCGKYFQGRGINTEAYMHSLQSEHLVYLNLSTQLVYELPANRQIENEDLQDIINNLKPVYTQQRIDNLDKIVEISQTLEDIDYMPGYVGLNNLKRTDYVNVVLQALCRMKVLRDYYLNPPGQLNNMDRRVSELICKMFNNQNFKGHVCPHELMQNIQQVSKKRFMISQQSDPIQLLAWLVQQLLASSAEGLSGLVEQSLQGRLTKRVYTDMTMQSVINEEEKSFTYLTIDIPQIPLYKNTNSDLENAIPHVSLNALLSKFNPSKCTFQDGSYVSYQLNRLPKYLILHFKRFVKNNFFIEKNPTIVLFPLVGLDLSEQNIEEKYDLIGNISHTGQYGKGEYKIQVEQKAMGQWLEIQDLIINKVMGQQVMLSETYILIYQQQ